MLWRHVMVSYLMNFQICSTWRFDDFQNAITITNAISESTGGGQIYRKPDCAISWTFNGMLMGFEWKYYGTCIDECTGLSSSAITYSKGGAIEKCLRDLLLKLETKEHIKVNTEL
ncbi:uncharacterized protein [Mytilus edulis]|uniref:uncharacterized protein n=1 Tax=Mytilus edulis TaxID=6550 RepID=UPI0039F14753